LRSALKQLLVQSGRDEIAEAADPIEGIRQIIWLRPNVIIFDTTWPQVNGLWLSRMLRELAPESKIVLLVDDSHLDYQEAARLSGADACVAKSLLAQELALVLAQWKPSEDPERSTEWSMA
jgi:DNA-binding NarL/FixJ family response regulator